MFQSTNCHPSVGGGLNNFQRLPLFSILYDDFLMFSENRDKDFKLGSRILIFLVLGTTHQLCIGHLNIRSGHEIEAAIRGLS